MQLAHLEDGLDELKFEDHIAGAREAYNHALSAAAGEGVPRSLYLFIAKDACSMRSDVLGDQESARELAQEVYGNYHYAAADMDACEIGTLDNIRQFLLNR